MNRYPLQVRAGRDPTAGRWLWLVKWLLLIPHYVLLAGLWIAFVVLTLVAYVVVLVTGHYPQGVLGFNVGVLRWTWRVAYYGYDVLGTDRYPPFTLAEVDDYPAGLTVDQPPQPKRWLPLVAWLLAIPHWLILTPLIGGGTYQAYQGDGVSAVVAYGLVDVAVLVAAIALLAAGVYPRGLYDLLIGVVRWWLRVVAYVALLTSVYPPFRLDQGHREPDDTPDVPDAPAAHQPVVAAARDPMTGLVFALVAGVLLLLIGIGLTAGGAAALALNDERDPSGYVSAPRVSLSTPTAAITAEELWVQPDDGWGRALGNGDGRAVRITASSPSGTPIFLGVADQSDVDRWLAGTAHDRLADAYTDDHPRYELAPGEAHAARPPAEQTFWRASAVGTDSVVLDWRPTGGHYAIVLANTDGTPGVTADAVVAVRVPNLGPLGAGLLVAGPLLLVAGVALTYLGASSLGRRYPPSRVPSAPI